MVELQQSLQEWHDTKSIALANDICEQLYKEMEAFENEPELD